MTTMTSPSAVNEAKAEFAARAGKEYFKQIRGELSAQGIASGTMVGINVLDGQYVLGRNDLELIDAFKARFGAETIGWFEQYWD